MHIRLAELMVYAGAQRARLVSAVESVPESLRNRRPRPDAWSVAEALEHLHRVETRIVRLFSSRLEGAQAAGLGPELETTSLLGSLDRFRLTERRSRMPAPEFVNPGGNLSAADGLAALTESRRTLLAAVRAGDGLALGEITYPHALLGALSLYEWLLFVGQHESRHADQIREIGVQLCSDPSDGARYSPLIGDTRAANARPVPWPVAEDHMPLAINSIAHWISITSLIVVDALGLQSAMEELHSANTLGQQVATGTQFGYAFAGFLAAGALLAGRSWAAGALWLWAGLITVTGTMAPIVWGGAGVVAGIGAGVVTAAVGAAMIWLAARRRAA